MKKTLSAKIITGFVCLSLGLTAQANSTDKVHTHDFQNKSTNQILEMIRTHLDEVSMNADYRFQRDAAAIAIGCDEIPWFFPYHKAKCFRDNLAKIKNPEMRFGPLVKSVCTAVQQTYFKNPDINKWIPSWAGPTFSNCMKNIVKALGTRSPLHPAWVSCERSRSLWDYYTKPECYDTKVNAAESTLEYIPKTTETAMEIKSDDGIQTKAVVATTPQLPPRSQIDMQKVEALYNACTVMNTNALPPELKGKVEYGSETYSVFRESHCFRDGLYAISFGATIPGTVMAACRSRIPGVEFRLPKVDKAHIKVKFDWNTFSWQEYDFRGLDINGFETRDFKTMCLKSGVEHSGDPRYTSIPSDSAQYMFEDTINLFGGWWFESSVYEDELNTYNDQTVANTMETQKQQQEKSKDIMKKLDELSPEELQSLSAGAAKALETKQQQMLNKEKLEQK